MCLSILSYLNVITMQVGVTLKARAGHSLTAFSICPGLIEVVLFGGSPEQWTGSDEKQPKMGDTTLLQLSECAHNYMQENAYYNNFRMCLHMITPK